MRKEIVIIILFSLTIVKVSYSQSADSSYFGVVNGAIKDSIHNYYLNSATVSAYTVADSSLQNYLLTNNFGEFSISRLPVKTKLKLIVTYTGYKTLVRNFVIGEEGKLDLGILNMIQQEAGVLDEVIVKVVPPVRLNGDTLEFNADAFKLDSNAVVEDLFKRLPGLTIWGDGAITFNGRKILNVYVEGKPFFGSDARVATQNLPKNAVDKVQLYARTKDQNNPLDSLMDINIKLKKNKQNGGFGKVGFGLGTRRRYDADGSYNIYSPRTQIGLAAAANNVNKRATEMTMLLRNASFKGIGTYVDYQPDFRLTGVSEPVSGGISLQHDFIANPNYQRTNRLTSNYFYSYLPLTSNQSTTTIISLDNSVLTQDSKTESQSKEIAHKLNSSYELTNSVKSFTLNEQFSLNRGQNDYVQRSTITKADGGIQSETASSVQDESYEKKIQMGVGFSKAGGQPSRRKHIPSSYDIRYNVDLGELQLDRAELMSFMSRVDPETDLHFARQYASKKNYANQQLSMKINDLNRLLFGAGDIMGIRLGLQNYLAIYRDREHNDVTDFDSSINSSIKNAYLSNKSNYTSIDVQPAISLKRVFDKKLVNRYQKSLSIDLLAKMQFYNQINVSQKSFQNLNRAYHFFLPSAVVSYSNRQFGEYNTSYKLSYATSTEYPTIYQIAPLIDSTKITDLLIGNPDLSNSYRRELSLSLAHSSERSKNPFTYNIKATVGQIDNRLSDSMVFDDQGRRKRFIVNLDGSQFLAISGSLDKALKIKQKLITIGVDSRFDMEKVPNYIDSKFLISRVTRNSNSLKLDFTANDLLSFNAVQGINFYQSKFTSGDVSDFKSSLYNTAFSLSVNCTKKLNVSSSISYNKNVVPGFTNTEFTIWNASISQRLLKGNNLEAKLSALDLLRQNKGIINYGNGNTLTTGAVNVLRQYFILTVAYYPRKFGKE